MTFKVEKNNALSHSFENFIFNTPTKRERSLSIFDPKKRVSLSNFDKFVGSFDILITEHNENNGSSKNSSNTDPLVVHDKIRINEMKNENEYETIRNLNNNRSNIICNLAVHKKSGQRVVIKSAGKIETECYEKIIEKYNQEFNNNNNNNNNINNNIVSNNNMMNKSKRNSFREKTRSFGKIYPEPKSNRKHNFVLLPKYKKQGNEGTEDLLVYPYKSGGELTDLIPKNGFSERESLHKFSQVMEALETVHSVGVAHRDIKPENIVLDHETNKLVLIDFGLAIITDEDEKGTTSKYKSTTTGVPMDGTLSFMAPELFALFVPKHFQYKAMDTWASGVLLLKLLTGKLPWESSSVYDAAFCEFSKLQKQNIGTQSTVFDSISKNVAGLICDMLALDPAKRLTVPEVNQRLKAMM